MRELEPIDVLRARLAYDAGTGAFTWTNGPRAGKAAGSKNSLGYVQIRTAGGSYYGHRLAWALTTGAWPMRDIDHINGDRADNRLSNLRDVPRRVNLENMRSARADNTSSRILGVEGRGKRYRARIQVNGSMLPLGTFATAEEAHGAYVAAKRQLHEGGML